MKENTKSFGLTEEDEMSATPIATMRKKTIIKVLRGSRCVFLVTYSLSSITKEQTTKLDKAIKQRWATTDVLPHSYV